MPLRLADMGRGRMADRLTSVPQKLANTMVYIIIPFAFFALGGLCVKKKASQVKYVMIRGG